MCEAGRPALTSSGVISSGKTADGSSTTARSKPSRSHKVHSAISAVASAIEVRQSTESTPAGLKKLSTKLVRVNDAGEIHVYVVLTEWSPEHVAALEALGLRVEATVPTRRLIQGWVPSHALDDVAALDAVKEVKPPAYGMREGAGAVNTPGDEILGAAAARAAFGVTGAGVKVGVISDGVDHLANSVMSNDLPAGVEVLSPGSGDEGTALLEIVHDLAPGAALAFYGPSTSVDMANGINALAAAGARVVMDDLSFFFEPKFEDGLIAETVRSFATGGRVYVSSAGNRAQQHYRATYSPVTGQNFPDGDYPAVHNYAPGSIDIGNTLVVPPFCSLTVILQWNNRFGAASDDFDLFIARTSDFFIFAASAEFQTGTQDPLEVDQLHQHDRVARHRLHRGVGVPAREPTRLAHPRLLRAPGLLRRPRAAVCDAERELGRQPQSRRGAADRCRERRDSGPGRGLQLAGAGHHQLPVSRGASRAGAHERRLCAHQDRGAGLLRPAVLRHVRGGPSRRRPSPRS